MKTYKATKIFDTDAYADAEKIFILSTDEMHAFDISEDTLIYQVLNEDPREFCDSIISLYKVENEEIYFNYAEEHFTKK